MPPKSSCDVALDELRPAGQVGVEALDPSVVEREDVVLARLDHEQPLQLVRASAGFSAARSCAWVQSIGCVELPDVVVERRQRLVRRPRACCAGSPRSSPCGRCRGCTNISKYWVLCRSARVRVVERVEHADALVGPLLDAVHEVGCGSPAASSTVGRDVDDVVELVRISPFALIPFGQCTIVPLRVPPQCEATCLVHWYGVFIACAQPTA